MSPLENITSTSRSKELNKHDGNIEKTWMPTKPRCRIPQRLPSPRPRIAQTNKPNSSQGAVVQHPKYARSTRPSSESRSRSRSSANRSGENVNIQCPAHKKAPFTNKRLQNTQVKRISKLHQLPNQETIKKREELELKGGYEDDDAPDLIKVKTSWERNLNQFECLKRDLNQEQRNIMELYAALRNTHKTMLALGQKATMPTFEDLKIMNVAKLTPDQLLQLCAGTKQPEEAPLHQNTTIDMNKFFEMPTKLVETCELTLEKRKEIIDWFQSLKSEEKGISVNKLTKKINEFNAENEMLSCSLNTCKTVFLRELGEVVDHMRKGVNNTVALQGRIEELTYEISDINAQNGDLRKQLQAIESLKSNKYRFEELEKELKEEKCKKVMIKDKLTRAEGQLKIANDRVIQMEAALDLARSQNWTLERTVQQLNDQNQKLQSDFDKELCKLTDSIKDNTVHLEEIAEAREKLQTEKEELEKRLQVLSDSYNESLNKMKEELHTNVTKLTATENKFEEEKEERKKLESNLETLCAKLLESEKRYKDVLKQMQAKDEELRNMLVMKSSLDTTKQKLEAANSELEDYKNRLLIQSQTIQEIERNFQETINVEKSLKSDIRNKEKYIAELEKNRSLLEQQLHEGEHKMEIYEQQLNSLKTEISQVHEEFGEFENMNQLHEMINEQRVKLLETTRQNGDLANALQQKDLELESHLEQLAEQQQLLEQRDGIIKMLTEKEEEQANIIKLLRNNVEMRAKADSDINQQLVEKNAEIESLVTNLETRKQQISQLEKIILTLEEQLRKVHLQRRNDHEKMTLLEKAITDYESFPADIKQTIEAPVDNLDNLIKILEDELDTSHDPTHGKFPTKKKVIDDHKKGDRIEHCAEGRTNEMTYTYEEDKPILRNPKKLVGNRDGDNLGRKKAITNMETQKWLTNSQPINVYTSSLEKKLPPVKGMVKVVQVMAGQRDDKKGKMLKLAGHNL